MGSDKGKHSNAGYFFMIGAMFLVLGIVASRGFLAIGIIFFLIGLTSLGRPPMRLLDELEERLERQENEDSAQDQPKNE